MYGEQLELIGIVLLFIFGLLEELLFPCRLACI
jgi:hypothetical protein